MTALQALSERYAWRFVGTWSELEVGKLQSAAAIIETYLINTGHADPADWMRRYLNAVFMHAGVLGQIPSLQGKSFVFPKNQVRLGDGFAVPSSGDKHVVHELGHVLDNNIGPTLPATFIGGGGADAMLKAVGGNPEKCMPRFFPKADYVEACTPQEYWQPRSSYGNTSVSEDFAEAFVHTICDPMRVPTRRRAWMQAFLQSLR